MADLNVLDQDLASRRGVLLGMTLAEVMLIVLFSLLLLLGKAVTDIDEERKANPCRHPEGNCPDVTGLNSDELVPLGNLIESIKVLPEEEREEAWEVLTTMFPGPESETTSLFAATGEEAASPPPAPTVASVGSPPPCLYNRAPPPKRRGESISLGIVHIERKHMTLIAKQLKLSDATAVDYLGRPARHFREAYDLLRKWPEGKRMTLSEFAQYGKEYLRIGNDESGGKLKCRFTMSYYIADRVPYDVFVGVFLQYFYMQQKISRDEFRRVK